MNWQTTIGLEVHVQLLTKSKIFSRAPACYGAEPNTQVGLLDFGLPGTLPVLNEEVLKMAIQFGLAVSGNIATHTIFARKNYFYPDLPKGYQISQQDHPIIENGFLEITLDDGTTKKISLERAHLEEDAGKSIHGGLKRKSGIDLNRAGTPLLEIVSKPELCNAKEAVAYLRTLHTLVRYLGICDGNLQEGSFRCDTNVSVRRATDTTLGTRVEIKNVNSFRFVERAINYEIQRQINILEEGGKIIQETRLYDEAKDETRAMRTKETAKDYRYFPDPDLLPVYISADYITEVKQTLPELPQQKYLRFVAEYGLSAYDANILVNNKELAIFYENAVKAANNDPKLTANWIIGDLLGALNKENLDITKSPISAEQLGGLVKRISDQTISGKIGKTVFEAMWKQEGDVDLIIEKHGLKQITNPQQIIAWIDEIIEKSPAQVAQYREGKEQLFGYFVGQIMKISQGKANPELLNTLLKEKLNNG